MAEQKKPGYPPGPNPGWFGFPILWAFRRDPLQQLETLYRDHGDAVSYRIGPFRQCLFFHPDHVRELLVNKGKSFIRFPMPMRVLKQWNGNSLLVMEGTEWIRKRRLVQPALQPRRLAEYFGPMVAETVRLADQWRSQLPSHGPLTVDVQPDINALTLKVISQTMFGTDLGAEAAEIGQAVAILSEVGVNEIQRTFVLPRWIPTPYNRRKNRAIGTIDRVVRTMIAEHEQHPGAKSNLLSTLLTHVETDPDGTQHRLAREEVRDEVTTLLLAGHDTTAAGLIWTLYCLAAHPEIQEQARAEIGRVIGSRPATMDDVQHLHVIDRIVKETLRLYPVAFGVFMRQASEDVEIGGWHLRKGDLAGTYSWVVHHDPRWYPDPERFDPDRFLPERFDRLPLGAYFPFGAGPRMCIGQAMATLEIRVALAVMLPRLAFSLVPGRAAPRALGLLSLRPEGGMPLQITAV